MSNIPKERSEQVEEPVARCPIDHGLLSYQKAIRPEKVESESVIERDAQGIWQVRGFEEARTILRSSATMQAGFGAEFLTKSLGKMNRPILYLEGKEHQQQRKKSARFFTPNTVSKNYRQFMEKLADDLIDELKRKKRADLSQLSLTLAVQVAARVVGVTDSSVPGMDKRLDRFFHKADMVESPYKSRKRGKFLSLLLQLYNKRDLLLFYWLDVKPAIRVRRRKAQEDVISYLIEQEYNDTEILTECVTYAAAGMVTTREFISVAAWHFLEHPALRARYLNAPEEERLEMLHEALRLESIVGKIERRTTTDMTITSRGKQITIPAGDLINIQVHATNTDQKVVGEEPLALCPGRVLTGDRVPSMMMSFGDGHHRCPGAYIAIQETDIFLQRLLALDDLRMERPPKVDWNGFTTGYEIRDFLVTLA